MLVGWIIRGGKSCEVTEFVGKACAGEGVVLE